jgi:hypothetical protein
MAEYSFSATEINPILDTNSDISYKNNTAIHPILKIAVDSYLRNNTEAMQMKEAGIGTGIGVFDQLPAVPPEDSFTSDAVQYQSSDYFPLYSGTVWEFSVNGNSKDISKVLPKMANVNGTITSVVLCGCGQKEYYTSDSNGIMLHRLFFPDVLIEPMGRGNLTITFIPPLQIADSMINIGQLFVSNGNAISTFSLTDRIIKLPYNTTYRFNNTENITVPAGNFDVLKISGSFSLGDQSVLQTFYLAEDIGIVKQVSDGTTQELMAFYYVKLSSPSEDEIISSGETYTMNWETTPYTTYFELLYSTDTGKTWNSITPDLVTATSYDWEVPSPRNNKTACLIKIIGYDSDRVEKTSVISKPFTIEVVKLISPNGGETLTSNTTWSIMWSTNATKTPVANVILQYTKNGGKTWKTITKITGSNPGTYDWNIPVVSKEKTNCRVKIILQNANSKVVGTDMSDDYFTITP